MKRLFFVAACLLPIYILAQQKGAAPIANGEAKMGRAFALCIGISNYQDADIPSLKYAHIDAEEFAKYLQSKTGGGLKEGQIEILTNEQATTANIYSKLDWLLEEVGESDRVIIYFSGHGDVETATSRNRGFLLAYDTPPTNYRIGALRVSDLNDILADFVELNKARVILITDACRSGKLVGGADGATATATALSEQFKNQVKIMSCQPDELSLEGEQWGGGRGAFSYHLLDGLTGMADTDGNAVVHLYELDKYLKEKIPQETDFQQFPLLMGAPKTTLSNVDAGELATLREKKDGQAPMLASVRLKGREDNILANADSTIQQLYKEFLAAVENQYFLPSDINENRIKGKSASELYDILSAEKSMQPLHTIMKRNFAVALQDESQKSINAYLKADMEEMKERWKNFGHKYKSNPAYLEKAASLLGRSHYLYDQLISKKYYYEGLLLRLEGEKTENDSLFYLALEKEKSALGHDGDAAYIFNEMGLIYKEIFKKEKRKKKPEKYIDGLYKKQISMFEKAAQVAPKWVMPHINLAGLYYINDELEKSETACTVAHALDSTQIGPIWYMGNIYSDKKDYEKAIKLYHQVINKYPNFNVNVYNNLGYAYYKSNDFDPAEKMYKKAIELDPAHPLAYENLGLLYYMSKKYSECISINKKWLDIYPDDNTAYYNIACLFSLQGKGAAAVEWLKKAIEKGYNNYDKLKKDADLENARNTSAYLAFKKKYLAEK